MARRSFTTSHSKIDEAMKEALMRLQKIHGNEFPASLQTIIDNVGGRRTPPSKPGARTSLERLQATGFMQMKSRGRGGFMFTFPGGQVAAASPSIAQGGTDLDGVLSRNRELKQRVTEALERIAKENEQLEETLKVLSA